MPFFVFAMLAAGSKSPGYVLEKKENVQDPMEVTDRAGDGIRTHDNDVGNVVLYQLSYTRKAK